MTTPTTIDAREEQREQARLALAGELTELARTLTAIAHDVETNSYEPWPLYDDLEEASCAIRDAFEAAVETGLASFDG